MNFDARYLIALFYIPCKSEKHLCYGNIWINLIHMFILEQIITQKWMEIR